MVPSEILSCLGKHHLVFPSPIESPSVKNPKLQLFVIKKMKHCFLIFVFFCMSCCGQAQKLQIHLQGGEVVEYPATMVDSLVFLPETEEVPSFELSCTDIGIASAHLYVKPSSDDFRYYYDITTAKSFDNAGGVSNIVEGFIQSIADRLPGMALSQILDIALSQGEDDDEVKNLPADTEYVFYAMAVNDEGKCYGIPATLRFRTLPGGNPADCTFELGYKNLSSTGLTITVVSSDPSVRYWLGVTPVSGYPGDVALMGEVRATLEEYAANTGMPLSEVVNAVVFAGDTEYEESGLQPSTPYYIYAYAMNEDGSAAGNLTKKRFATTDYDISTATVDLSFRYFDGDALAVAYPESCSGYAGSVVVDASITPSEDASTWVVALANGDLSDNMLYPDAQTKQAVLSAGFFNVREKRFLAKWGTVTFLGFAADAVGVDGPLYRKVVNLTPSDALSVDEFLDTSASDMQLPNYTLAGETVCRPFQMSSLSPVKFPKKRLMYTYRRHFEGIL